MPSHLNAIGDWRVLAEAAHYRPKQLAGLCHVSLRQLERFFSEKTGCSPQKWLNDLRLDEAPRRLLKGDHVKQVAFELGFTHPSNFIREFRRVYHCTPLEFVFSQRSQGNDRRFLMTSASPSPGGDPFGTSKKAGSFLPKTRSRKHSRPS
jgi:AraC-like DNA-binding protein